MNRERARRRGEIATAALQGLLACPDVRGEQSQIVRYAINYADSLILELDLLALADTPDADPVRQLAELQDLQEAKDAAANRSVAKSILIWQRDRQIADLQDQLAALKQFVDRVRVDAEHNPELYAPFVALLRDLDAKVGVK